MTSSDRTPRRRDSTDSPNGKSDEEATRRRRGRRGGRKHKRAEGEASTDIRAEERPSKPRVEREERRARPERRNGKASDGGEASEGRERRASRDRYDWGRRVDGGEADERSRRANRRRRDVRSRNLDQPLPEDVAFRPGVEGGDSSILPSRRRRPSGLQTTARILVGGARTLGGGLVRRGESTEAPPRAPLVARPPQVDPTADDEHEQPAAASSTGVEAGPDVEDDATEEGGKRRRRGRRGGRGRRRGDVVTAPADQEDEAEAEAADDEAAEAEADVVVDEGEQAERPRVERRTRGSRRAARALTPIADEDLPAEFAGLGVSRTTLEALARFGFTDPTPIQREAIPALLNNLDVVGIAQTGSGKTVAFGVPMMERLDPEIDEIQGLVLVPTRELAQQVLEVLQELGESWGLSAVGLLGGHSLRADFKALEARPQIVVGTPGRILDHLRRQTLSLRHVRYAVLDEADQMLDIGFLPDIRRILSRTPQRRQTALFSATMPGSIKRLIWQFMTDPETVRVDPEATPVETIRQTYFEVAQRDKVRGLRELIERELKGRTLIFSNTKRGVDFVARELERDGVRVGALHGDMDQRRRDRVVQDFREGALDVLIATNVAARGLDIPEITHVVNYDVPQNREEYVHRIGRTGRAGREGRAITLVSEWDIEAFDVIRKELGVEIVREEFDLYGTTSTPAPRAED